MTEELLNIFKLYTQSFERLMEMFHIPALEDDKPAEKPVLEKKRQWSHGKENLETCGRAKKKVFTNPQELPSPCGDRTWGGGCGNGDWQSDGVVWRDKKTKTVVGKVREQ